MVYSIQSQLGDGVTEGVRVGVTEGVLLSEILGVGDGVGEGHGSPEVQSSQLSCSVNVTPKPT